MHKNQTIMKFLTEKAVLKFLFLFLFFSNFNTLFAQEVTVTQDPKLEQLLNEKRKVNSSITINNQYKIQVFNGSSEESKKTLIQFKKENRQTRKEIKWENRYENGIKLLTCCCCRSSQRFKLLFFHSLHHSTNISIPLFKGEMFNVTVGKVS